MSNERSVNPGSSPLTEGLKRKRGRPKKQPQKEAGEQLLVKKPRGRPKGSKKVSTVTGQMVEPPAGKRPRGRPRKWPQLVIQEGTSEEGSPQGSSDLNLNSAPVTQVSSRAPAPVSLPATKLRDHLSRAAGPRVTSSPPAPRCLRQCSRASPKPQPTHHWKRRFQAQQNYWS